MSGNTNKCKELIAYIKQNFWTSIFFALLVVQFLLIAVCNIKLIDNNIDCDSAKILVHAMKMGEHGTLLVPGWSYMTSLEIDCPSSLAAPLYMLTKDIYLAYGLANIIILAAFISLLFFLFRGKPVIYPILAANLMCIPYSKGMLDYFNMMFFSGSHYVIRVAMPLLMIALLLWSEETAGQRKRIYEYIPLVLFGALMFLCSFSSGVYVLFVGIFPIIVTYVLYKVLMSEKPPVLSCVVLGECVVVSVLGIVLNGVYAGGSRGAGMTLISVYQILANVYSCIAGIYELFGGIAQEMELAVMSPEGINILMKAILVHIFLICGIIGIIRIAKKKIELRMLLLLSVFIWNMFVLLATNTRAGSATYEYRYHLIGMLPLMFVAVQILLEAWFGLKRFQKNFFAAAVLCFVLVINVLSFSVALDPTDEQIGLKELCAYFDPYDYDFVYMYDASNEADMCKLIRENDTEYINILENGDTWAYDYYKKYENGKICPENAVMVVNTEKDDLGDSFENFGYKFVKFDAVGSWNLYYFAE